MSAAAATQSASGAPEGAPALDRLSLNVITTNQWTLREAVQGCVDAGLGWIGPWRQSLADAGVEAGAAAIQAAGLRVSGLCRGGFFPAADAAGRRAAIDDNRRAIEEAAIVGADVLVLVCGPPLGRDLAGARAMIAEGIEQAAPYAQEHGVRLAIEPLHPMMIAERSAIVTLGEANDLAERFDGQVGVIVDAYHVWWDPDLERQIARAGDRIFGYHVSDWLVPTEDRLNGRGIMGDGIIPLRRIREAVEAAGYAGPIEVEVINPAYERESGEELLARIVQRYLEHV